MVYLVVRIMRQTKEEREKLESMLKAWDLKVIQDEIDERKSLLKLSINASMPSTMDLVVSIAQKRFQEDLLESNVRYEPE